MEDQVDGNEDYGDKLPVGFRFLPTDVEFVTHYLINKMNQMMRSKPGRVAGQCIIGGKFLCLNELMKEEM
ncbi:hypothetical protein Gotur_013722 [Gossypium turneri]